MTTDLMRKVALYGTHILIVAATIYLATQSGLFNWYWCTLILVPLALNISSRFASLSYTLNVRILFPISVGIFYVCLYHYFPTLISENSNANLSKYGISNSGGDGISRNIFVVNSIFIEAVTVLYAVCAAFLLWKGLNDFDALKTVLYEEANEINSISDYTIYFGGENASESNINIIRQIKENLVGYINNMAASGKIIKSEENEIILRNCLTEVRNLEPLDTNDRFALAEIMKGISRLSVLRSNRVVCIEKQMSPFILVLIFLMSVAMVASFFGSATEEFSVDYIYIFLLPTFYTSIFMTLIDLSSPFDGYWNVKIGAMEEVRARLQKELGMQVIELSSDPLILNHPSSALK